MVGIVPRQRYHATVQHADGNAYLYGLGERAVVVDGVAVGLDGDLLLHARLHHAVALRLVLGIQKTYLD